MTTKRELAERLRASTDSTFVPTSSTLVDRLPDLARASGLARAPRHSRVGRRFAAVLGSIGIVGWMTMAGAGAAVVGVSATGALPDPVQQFVADLVENVGIDLPDPAQARRENERRQEELESGIGKPGAPSTAPGSTAPGSSGEDSSNLGSAGNSGNAPGQSGSSPGNSGNAPGQSGSSPGNSGNAPGQSGSRGNSPNAVGGSTTSPGNSGNAPGQSGTSNGSARGKA